MAQEIKTFKDYLEFRKLGFFLPFCNLTQSHPLMGGGRITIEELEMDYLEYMQKASEPIRIWV